MRGSAQLAPAHKGSTTPRVFTPPLPEHCEPLAQSEIERLFGTATFVECPCGCGLHPGSSWGFECIDFLEKVLCWTLIPYQKWLYIHALERDELFGTGFRFDTILVLIARQNGKTQWLKGLGLWKLYLDGAKNVLLSAQTLPMAEKTLEEVVADVKGNRILRKEYRRYITTNGKHKLILKPLADDPFEEPRHWLTQVAGPKGGRSLSIDLAMLDELRLHKNWEAWNAITPTTQARPRSLTVCASNAGDVSSVVLRSLRDGATAKILTGSTAGTAIFMAEWSVPDEADPLDETFWRLANPALGYLFPLSKLRAKCEAVQAGEDKDNINGFKTEYLCQWVLVLEPGIFPAKEWKDTTDPGSRRAAGATVFAGLDVNFERSKAYVGVAARRDDLRLHFEVAKAERGTDWIVPWFSAPERQGRFECVVIQARGAPASGLIEELREAGVPVAELGGPDLTKAYGHFYDLIVNNDGARHRPSPVLDEAAESAKAKAIGDAWVIDRKNSPTDASPLVACIQAAAGEWCYEKPEEVEVWGFVS